MLATTMSFRWYQAAVSICVLAMSLAALAFSTPKALAQDDNVSSGNYLRLPVDQKLAKRVKSSRINVILREGFSPATEKVFAEYYQKCVFPLWTDPANFSVQGKVKDTKTPREKILADLRRAKSGSSTYGRVNSLVKDQMIEFVKGNYHPATRFNAMLTLGELNEEKPGFGDDPKPLASALPLLLSAATNDNLPDSVRLAAMLGLVRHGKYGAKDQDSRNKISNLMLTTATTRIAPQGRTKDGHAWFRRLAIDMLGRFGTPGQNGVVAKALANIVAESEAPLSVRCEAAKALGWLALNPNSGVDPGTVARALDDLFVDVCKEEIELGKEDEDYVINVRRLKARLADILAALSGSTDRENTSGRGISPLATKPEDAELVRSLKADIEKLMNREHLDHADLTPKDENPKKKKADEKKTPGMGREPGLPEEFGPPGPMRMGGMMGGVQPGQPDPAKAVSDKIMAELIRLVKKRGEG